MKVLYDHQAFTYQQFGGVSNYYVELFKNASNFEAILALQYTNNVYFKENKKYKKSFFKFPINSINKILNRQLFKKINKCNSIKTLLQVDYEIFHPTYYDSYFLKYLHKKPYIITVYDMIDELFYPETNDSDSFKLMKKRVVQNANKIIAISNKTKEDIIKLYKIPENKIEVIYLASSLQKNNSNESSFKNFIPPKYILFIGNRTGYKNFNLFIEATTSLLLDDKNLHIICTGKNFTIEEIKYFQLLGIEKQLIHFFVEDNNFLAYLYQHAQLFIFPSLYEDVGIPILEAFNCGCPVLLSNASCFPEIADNAGYYFNPTEKKSIFIAVKNMLENKDLRDEYIELGYEKTKIFSWQKTAEQTGELYKKLVT